MKPVIWTTATGDKVEVSWMTSAHLVHSINRVIRNNQLTRDRAMQIVLDPSNKNSVFTAMIREAEQRQLLCWAALDALRVPKLRETQTQLAMLRAMIDTHTELTLIEAFYTDPDGMVKRLADDPLRPKLRAKFVEYRLAR